jgi:carbon-monoxide dehydrogenase medium subunit
MYPFAYSRPESIQAAVALMQQDENVRYLSGGMSLLPSMKLRLSAPTRLVDITHIAGLRDVSWSEEASVVRIGAAATHYVVNQSSLLQEKLPALCQLAGGIGDVQVRYRGTIGGSIANNDPAADYPAAVLALNAKIVTDRRVIAADEFFRGMFETSLDQSEIITAVDFSLPRRAAYIKFANQASRFAIVGVFLADFNGDVRVAVTGAGPCVFRLAAYERALSGAFTPEAIDFISLGATDFTNDLHASAEYRAHLTGVLVRQAVSACLECQNVE